MVAITDDVSLSSTHHQFPSVQGSEKDHGKIREEVVQYMESHHDEFAPFVEDDEGFEKYMKRMRKVRPLRVAVHCV